MHSVPFKRLSTLLIVAALLIALGGALLFWRSSQAALPSPTAQTATATPAPTRAAPAAATPTESTADTVTDPMTDTVIVETPDEEASAEPLLPGAVTSLALDELDEYGAIPVGFTDAGLAFMGDPAAPVTMIEYSDYLCPFCGRHFAETLPILIDEYVLTGKLRMVFQDFPIPSLHPTAPQGHVAALCVGEEGPVAYWAMHDQLFGRQNEWNQVADPTEFLADAAEQSGADLDAYAECLESGRTEAQVEAGMAEGMALGFNGTPTFLFAADGLPETYTLIGAYPIDSFRLWIDSMLAGEAPPAEPQAEAEAAQLPAWATAEGLAADPENPGFNIYGDMVKGSDDAPVTIVEFSDFQCPACGFHNTEVQPTLNEEFVETGKVRWVFKHRPLAMHPFAPVSAAAAECAAEQGMFWEMHESLFANVEQWAPEDESWTMADAEAALSGLAKELELDSDIFDECLNGRHALERVLQDVFDSEGIVSSTPTFIVLYGEQGTLLSGSRPVEEFTEILNSFIELAGEDAVAE